MDPLSSKPDKSLIAPAPPTISPGAPTFPLPNLQQDQVPSSSIKYPTMLSPANGVKTGSSVRHLSTPPAPPVFTSPVRPAAMPFRTSPATPQQIDVSSGSYLPTFSPPYFSNGSVEVLKHKKQANVLSLGFGVLVSPGRETLPGPQVVQRDSHRCLDCGAYSNLYSNILIGSGQWQCVICGNLNGSEGEYIALSKMSHTFSIYRAPCMHLLIRCRTVSVYDFSEESIASADVIPGGSSPNQETLKALIYGTGVNLSPMHASIEVAHLIFSSLRPYKLTVPEASRDRCWVLRLRPNTYGPGSVPYSYTHPNYPHKENSALKWMEHLGREAHQQNTVVDILCAGTCPVRVPVLLPLAKASGGVFVLHDDFSETFGMNLQRASVRAAGSHGLLEIRCSDDILITQVVGPGEEARIDTHETFKNDISLYITRVVTIRLPTVDSVPEFLQSVEDGVAAVLIAKRTLLGAKSYSDAIDMRTTIDERVKDIALKFSSQAPKSKLHWFPKEISLLPEILFHLRRGPLLGNIVGHEDERSVLRNLFLNASLDLSLLMVAPHCLMHQEGGTFEELPAYDLVIQSDTAVVLDHGTDVFIWLGAELAADEARSAAALAACRTLAEELTEL
ncbi:bifunctional glutamate/proline--tRNA ligase-like [Hibiscus syriacus]|uniref:Protein transport protein SEC23 n=1 Tax=Hibiscus syriacus TaxID=106335 RepID=A0A6A3A7A8_HIBSY|nr:bifunctional glutamate/proline--tRNA ligase-like [Hibiscus syriacus]